MRFAFAHQCSLSSPVAVSIWVVSDPGVVLLNAVIFDAAARSLAAGSWFEARRLARRCELYSNSVDESTYIHDTSRMGLSAVMWVTEGDHLSSDSRMGPFRTLRLGLGPPFD